MEKGDSRGGCKWHPRKQGEGVCAWCLRESLIKLVSSQEVDEDNSFDVYEEKLDSKRIIANGSRRKEGESHFPLVQLRRSKSACDGEAKKVAAAGVDDNHTPSKITRYGLKGLRGAVNFEGVRGEQEMLPRASSHVQNFHYTFSERKPNSQAAPSSRARAKSSWKSAVSRITALKNAWGMFWKSDRGKADHSPSNLKPEYETQGKLAAAINGDQRSEPSAAAATDASRLKRTSIGSRVSPWSSRASLLRVGRKSASGAHSMERNSNNKESRAVGIIPDTTTFQDFSSQEHDIGGGGGQGISFDTDVVEESPRESGFAGDQCVANGRMLERSCQNHTDVNPAEGSYQADDENHNNPRSRDAKQSLPESGNNKASPWRLFSRSSPRTQVQSDELPISMSNIFKTRISRSKSVQKPPQVASPSLDSKQATTGSTKPSPLLKTLSRSSSKWSPFSSNSKMNDEAAWFPDDSPGRTLKCILQTQSASSSPYTSKADAAKHSSRSSKTSPWSSSLSRPSSKASPLILSSNAQQTRDQTRDKVSDREVLNYRLDPDGEIRQFLQSRSSHFKHELNGATAVVPATTGDNDDNGSSTTLNPHLFQSLSRPTITGGVQNSFHPVPLYKRHRSIPGTTAAKEVVTGVWN